MSAISCSRSFCRSSSIRSSSSRLGARHLHIRFRCLPHMFTSFLSCSIEEERDAVPQRLERYEPRVECSPAVRGELVRSLRGARKVGAPLGPDEAVLLECPERPVHVSDVDALVDEK